MEEQTFSFYDLLTYHTFNDNCLYRGSEPNKLFTTKDGQICVQPMWRMEQIAKYYGVDIHDYDDKTAWKHLDELLRRLKEGEDCTMFRMENIMPDTYDDYFEAVARVAAEIGDERAEIKCLAKSLILKYHFHLISNIGEFPHQAFAKLYGRLIASNDLDQIRVAERLARHHIRELEAFAWCDIENKKMQAGWVEPEDREEDQPTTKE